MTGVTLLSADSRDRLFGTETAARFGNVSSRKPKSYTGNFRITPERFVFKMNADAKKLEDLFVGRYVNVDDDDELPLSLCAVAKRILKRGNKVSKQASK
jgi:hypothetical protein